MLRRILNEFIYGGHLLSLGASAIIFTFIIILNLEPRFEIILIPYLISQVIYSYNHFREAVYDAISNPERTNYLSTQNSKYKITLALYFITLLIICIFTNIQTLGLTIIVVLGGILYTEYFKEYGIKKIVGFKNFYTSGFGTFTLLLVPAYYGITISAFIILFLLFVFLRLIVNAIFFDIKDISSDSERGLKTFPVYLGKFRTIVALHIINILSIVPLYLGIYSSVGNQRYLILAVLPIYAIYYLMHALFLNDKNLRMLSYVVVDAEYVFWPILVLIAKNYF